MNEYPNWFRQAGADRNFARFLTDFVNKPISALQIGAFTGDASLWMMQNVLIHPDARLTDVDTWEGSDEVAHKPLNWQSVEQIYDAKVREFLDSGQLIKQKGTSDHFFSWSDEKFDFIYVDGDHTAAAVLKDGVNAVKALKPGGILAFDDYMWRSQKGPTYDPYPSVDAIMNAFKPDFEVLEIGLQVWLKHRG